MGAKDARPMRTLGRYVMPLSLVVVAVDVAEQFLNIGIVRAVGPDDSETLAAFGLAYRLTRVCTSPLVMLRPVALVLVQTGKERRKVTRFALLLAAFVAALLFVMARTPATLWLTGVGAGTREEAQLRLALVMLCGVPALDGTFRLYSGLLLRRHQSVVVSGASLADVVAQVSIVTTLLHATPPGSPLWIPVASLYAGRLAKCAVAVLAFHRPGAKTALAALPGPARPTAAAVAGPAGGDDGCDGSKTPSPLLAPSRRLLELPHRAAGAGGAGGHAASFPASLAASDRGGAGDRAFVVPEEGSRPSGTRNEEAAQALAEAGSGAVTGDSDSDGDGGGDDGGGSGGGELSVREVVSFMAPLAANEFIARLSRPLVNAVVASGADGTEEVAALTLAYPIAHLFYGWLNEVKSTPAAFRELPRVYASVPRFAAACAGAVVGVSCLVFFSPAQRWFLMEVVGASAAAAARCRDGLRVFAFFPIPVILRAVLQGRMTAHKRTKHLGPSGPARLASLAAALITLPLLGVRGATLGIAALYCGFLAEAVAVLSAATFGGMRELGDPPTGSTVA